MLKLSRLGRLIFYSSITCIIRDLSSFFSICHCSSFYLYLFNPGNESLKQNEIFKSYTIKVNRHKKACLKDLQKLKIVRRITQYKRFVKEVSREGVITWARQAAKTRRHSTSILVLVTYLVRSTPYPTGVPFIDIIVTDRFYFFNKYRELKSNIFIA